MRGQTVCRLHGGASPQAKRKAAERLADLIDPDRVLREAARLAYSDIRQLCDADGHLLPIAQWPDHLAAAVSGVEVVRRNIDAADGQTEQVHKIKLWDKPKNLELLFKHLGLLKETLTVTLDAPLLERLDRGRRRNAGELPESGS
jgi:phage terminase small subunit